MQNDSIKLLGAMAIGGYTLSAVIEDVPFDEIGRRAIALTVVYVALLGLEVVSPELAHAFALLFATIVLLPIAGDLARLVEKYI